MATQLSTFTELGLVDARASAGSITLPLSTQIPGRVLTFKDIYGAVANSTIVITTSSPDVFEDGTSYRTLINPYDFLTVYAGSTGVWYVVGGNQFNWMRAVNQSNTGTSYLNNISTNFLYAISNVSTLIMNTSNLNTTNVSASNISSFNYVATNTLYSFSTVTSNITHFQGPTATIFAGASFAPAYSTSRISTLSLGTSTNRWFQTWSLSTIASTIITDNAIVNNLVGGPILTATTTTNIYPFSAGSLVGFGATTASNGFYAEGHFRSTFTQVIQPTLDNDGFSNIVRINGNISTPNIYTSTIYTNFISTGSFYISSFNANSISAGTLIFSSLSFQNISIGTGFISSLNVNSLTFGTGTGYADFTALRAGLVSSIQADTGAQKLSSLNLKMPPFWSTLSIPTSSFTINGANAGTPIVLYSNVQFPPYTKGLYKIYQKAILSKTGGANPLDLHGNIFYTQGTFPSSTTLFHDGYSALPFVNNTGTSTFTTCVTMVSISSITTRNISYYDASAAGYTANLYLGNLAVEYVPSLGFSSDIGQNIYQ